MQLIEEELSIEVPTEEAILFALHFVNVQSQKKDKITKFIEDVLTIVKYEYKRCFNEDSLSLFTICNTSALFCTECDYHTMSSYEETTLYGQVVKLYPVAFQCIKKILYWKYVWNYNIGERKNLFNLAYLKIN